MLRLAAVLSFCLSFMAHSAPTEDHWGSPPSADYGRAADLVASAKYDEALPILLDLADTTPGDADLFNLLGFTHRKMGDLDSAASYYQRALRLSPDHRGALAYQGELFLKRSDLPSAEANLARLASLCPTGCQERDELTVAVANWKAARD